MDFAGAQLTSSIEENPYEMETYPERPLVKSITVPETVKRRVPTKHYVSGELQHAHSSLL